jgi:hypothetical protein
MYLIIGETWCFLFEIHDQKFLLEKKMNKSSLFRKTKLNEEKKFSKQDLIIPKLSR